MDELESLLRGILSTLVDSPGQLLVRRLVDGAGTTFVVTTAPGETGQLIGKQGRIGNSLRIVIKAVAAKSGVGPVYLDIRT